MMFSKYPLLTCTVIDCCWMLGSLLMNEAAMDVGLKTGVFHA